MRHLIERLEERYGSVWACVQTVRRHKARVHAGEAQFVGEQPGRGAVILRLEDRGRMFYLAWNMRLRKIETYLTEGQAEVWERRQSPLFRRPWLGAADDRRMDPLPHLTESYFRST